MLINALLDIYLVFDKCVKYNKYIIRNTIKE